MRLNKKKIGNEDTDPKFSDSMILFICILLKEA